MLLLNNLKENATKFKDLCLGLTYKRPNLFGLFRDSVHATALMITSL